MVNRYNIGPVATEARTKTDARETCVTRAAKVLERLENCPEPLPGPPDTEILAIVFRPGIHSKWITQYIFPDRVLSHASENEIGLIRREAVEFVAQHGLSRHTSKRAIEKLTDWADAQLLLSAADAEVFAGKLRQLVLRCEAAYELQNVRKTNGSPLTSVEVHEVLCGAPTLTGELLELYKHHIQAKGIR